MATSITLPAPGEGSSAKSWAALKRMVPFDSAALLLIDPARPNPEGVLATRSVTGKQLGDWLDTASKGDALLKQAAKDGQAAINKAASAPTAGLPKGLKTAAAALGCAPGDGRCWALAVGRRKGNYSDTELDQLGLTLMAIRNRFDTVPHDEPGLQRILTDDEGQVIHADTETRLSLSGDLGKVQSLVDHILAIDAQRWPGGAAEPHDLFPPHRKGPGLWARVTRQPDWARGLPGPTMIAIRPIDGLAPPGVGLVEDDRIAQAMGVISDRYAESISLNDLAEHFDVSPFHFHRLFSSQAEISPKHYNLRIQLLHARHILRTTRVPIRDVADACGFASHGHFTATFHRMVGLTPADYRLGVSPP